MHFIFDKNKKLYYINGELSDHESSLRLQRNRFLFACLDVIGGQKWHSPIARLVRGLIVHALPKKDTDKFFNSDTRHRLFGQKAPASATRDIGKAILYGDLLRSTPRTIEKVSEACLVYALPCMLSTDNVGVWSWGDKVKVIKTYGGRLRTNFFLPKIFVRKSPQDIWDDYHHQVSTDENTPWTKIGMTLFREILRMLLLLLEIWFHLKWLNFAQTIRSLRILLLTSVMPENSHFTFWRSFEVHWRTCRERNMTIFVFKRWIINTLRSFRWQQW